MTQKLKSVKITAILGLLLFSTFVGCGFSSTAKAIEPLIQFTSYVDLQINTTELNQPFAIDTSVNVPVKVFYWTDIPAIYKSIPFPFNNLIYFGRTITPMQKIHLEVVNPPDWANMYIGSPDVIVEIPVEGEDRFEIPVDLVISPRIEAPAVPHTITIKATCEGIYRLKGIEEGYIESVDFTPSFVPTVQIDAEKPLRTVSPRESVNFVVKVKNLGNKITRVTPEIVNPDDDWSPIINPPVREIHPGEEDDFTFSIYTPYGFGWHDEVKAFQIEFKSEIYPYRTDSPVDTRSVYIRVNNYGFATSGIEIVLAVVIVLAIIVIVMYMRKQRKS